MGIYDMFETDGLHKRSPPEIQAVNGGTKIKKKVTEEKTITGRDAQNTWMDRDDWIHIHLHIEIHIHIYIDIHIQYTYIYIHNIHRPPLQTQRLIFSRLALVQVGALVALQPAVHLGHPGPWCVSLAQRFIMSYFNIR